MKISNSQNTSVMALVLAEILSRPTANHWGRDIVERRGIRAGTVLPILRELEMCGWLTSCWDEELNQEVPLRRLYKLTATGKSEATTWLKKFRDRTSVNPDKSGIPHLPVPPKPQAFEFG